MELFNHPKAAGAVLLARLLTREFGCVTARIAEMLHTHYDVDYCAGKWKAYSEYQYCAGCKRVVVLSAKLPVTVHLSCSSCSGTSNGLAVLSMVDLLTRVEPVVQELAMEYLYWRQHAKDTSESSVHGQANTSNRESTTK